MAATLTTLSARVRTLLADANALVAPMSRVRTWLQAIKDEGILPEAGIYSFIDAFDVARKTENEWRELAARDLPSTVVSAGGSATIMTTTSAPPAASRGVAATVAPNGFNTSAFAAVRLCARTA